MTKHRIQLKTPDYNHSFEIENGSARENFIWWEFTPAWDTLKELRSLGGIDVFLYLDDVLRVAGSHATLWLDDWQGTIAPMDVPPQGWTYPSGLSLEPEWWWMWYPSEQTAKEQLAVLNQSPFEAWQSDVKTPFKSMIPFQMQRNLGTIEKIEAIPMMRLPGLIRKQVNWIFEFDR